MEHGCRRYKVSVEMRFLDQALILSSRAVFSTRLDVVSVPRDLFALEVSLSIAHQVIIAQVKPNGSLMPFLAQLASTGRTPAVARFPIAVFAQQVLYALLRQLITPSGSVLSVLIASRGP